MKHQILFCYLFIQDFENISFQHQVYWDAVSANLRTTPVLSVISSLAIVHLKIFEHQQTIQTMQRGSEVLWFCDHLLLRGIVFSDFL